MLPALELKDCHQLNIVIALLKIVKKHMNWSSIQLQSEDPIMAILTIARVT